MLQKKQLLQNGSLKNPLTNHFCAGRRNSLRFFWILERCLYRTKLLIPLLKTKAVRISYLFFLWLLFSCQKNHEPVSKVSMPTHPNPEVAEEIANSTNSELIQTMGNKITLFRARKKNSKINLPK